jgi:hypothetical protein
MLVNKVSDGFILEENIFDHNGWLIQNNKDATEDPREATIFNHNLYIEDSDSVIVRNNISTRSSSIGMKFSNYVGPGSAGPHYVLNNLCIDNEVGITMIGANSAMPLAVVGVEVLQNVITGLNNSRPTNRDIGWGIDLMRIDGGIVNDNLIYHNNATNSHAILHGDHSRNLSITNNVVYDFKNVTQAIELEGQWGTDSENITFSNNKIQVPENSGYIIKTEFPTTGKWTFSNNKYFSNVADGARFKLNNIAKTNAQWATETGDNSTFEQVSFPDPTRSVETYMASIGETATIDAFIAKCRAMDRYNWDTRFTADRVNTWIRQGFGLTLPVPSGILKTTVY